MRTIIQLVQVVLLSCFGDFKVRSHWLLVAVWVFVIALLALALGFLHRSDAVARPRLQVYLLLCSTA